MRRQRHLTIPIAKDVCVFCATRQQFASARPPAHVQRRFFRSTISGQRASAAAVARQKEDNDTDTACGWGSEPSPRQSSGGWSATTAARDLTPEEQALRDILQKSKPSPAPTQKYDGGNESSQRPREREIEGFRLGHRFSQQRDRQQKTRQDGGRNSQSSDVDLGWNEQAKKVKLEGKARHFPSREAHSRDSSGELRPRSRQQPLSQGSRYDTGRDANSDTASSKPWRNAFRRGNWDCPSCGFNNYGTNGACHRCRKYRPPSISRADQSRQGPISDLNRDAELDYHIAQSNNPVSESEVVAQTDNDDALRVNGWKHLKRRTSSATEQPGAEQEVGSTTAEVPVDTESIAKTRAAEQERMARLEKTKDGRFVGLHSGRDIHRRNPFPTTTRHQQDGQRERSTPASSSDLSVKSKSSQGWTRWEPSLSTGLEGTNRIGSIETVPESRQSKSLQGWEYPLEQQGVPNEAARGNDSSLMNSSEDTQTSQSSHRSDISFDPRFEEDFRPHQQKPYERSKTQGFEGRVRGSGIEVTSAPVDRNRYKERKSKKFVSTIDEFEEDDDKYAERRAQRKKQREKAKVAQKAAAPPTPIYLPEFISVSNLAGVLRVRVEDFIRKMKDLGFEETNNDHVLDAETAGLVAAEFNFEPIIGRVEDNDLLPLPPSEDKSILPPRPPVVTIMGHVDHGKTTLLDYLRKSSVAASEHGGITQHIGAFSVLMPGGRLVTFLDTPGHEAFLSMRQRGANVTDIVILVVAADDSVKPQTIEAIKHAQAAKVPMIVAVNKIDKEDSNVDRVKQDLARYGVEIEDFGGDTQIVCVSGKTGQGMEELEDATVALADILDMRSEVDGQAEGWVLEATTKKAGRVATVLVRRGTLRPSDVIVAGTSWARVRSLRNEAGAMVPSAGPGIPVEIDGWREQPAAGDEVIQAPDEQKAKSVIEYRLEASDRTKMAADMEAVNEARRLEQEKREQLEKAAELAAENPNTPPNPQQQPQQASTSPTFQEVFFIVKADVSGSVEAVTNSVSALGNSEIRPHILRSGVGPITEFDIDHAAVAKGHIINFNTVVEGQIQRMAESKDVNIIDQSIIYRLVDDVKAKLGEKLKPTVTQRVLGEAEIAQVFEINTKGRATVPVAGCRIRNGVIGRTAKIRVLRDKEVVFDGSLSSLKNVKKDVTEMRKGTECGMSFESWTGFKAGDQIQAYEESVEKRTL